MPVHVRIKTGMRPKINADLMLFSRNAVPRHKLFDARVPDQLIEPSFMHEVKTKSATPIASAYC